MKSKQNSCSCTRVIKLGRESGLYSRYGGLFFLLPADILRSPQLLRTDVVPQQIQYSGNEKLN
jgi:hypothetical protein